MNQAELKDHIVSTFDKWISQYLKKTLYGAQIFTKGNLRHDQSTFNSYLKTEDDFKVKFGGYLEQSFLINGNPDDITVQSEMYASKKRGKQARVDLSVHSVKPERMRFTQIEIESSFRAIIEIKSVGYFPNSSISKEIESDIEKIKSLSPTEDCLFFLMVMLENPSVLSDENILKFINLAGPKIRFLSNDIRFHNY